jgi:hypothetical protein
MDVCLLCVLYSKGQKAKPGKSGQRNSRDKKYTESKKNPNVGEIFLTPPDRPWRPTNPSYNG